MASRRKASGRGAVGRLVFVGVLLIAAAAGCAGAGSRPGAIHQPAAELVFRNLSPQTVWIYLDAHRFGQLLGSVPPFERARLRIPGDLARARSLVTVRVARHVHVPGMAEVVAEVALPIEEVRTMEWTLAGSTLSQSLLRGVPLAGGRGRP